MDTPPEKAVDDLTALAAHLCATPMAFVGLIDADRQWLKSRQGVAFTEIPRDDAFCVHPRCNRDVVVVSDTRRDCGLTHSPLMTALPELRFYARAPLMTADGYVLGALCVLDTAPRTLSELQRHHLKVVAAQVISQFELRRQTRVLPSVLEERSAALVALRAKQRILDGVLNHTDVLMYAKDLEGRFVLANPAVERATHAGSGELIGRTDHDVLPVQMADRYRSNDLHIIATRQWQVFVEDLVDPDGSTRAYRSTKFPLIDDTGEVIGIGGVSTDVTELDAARAAHAEAEQRWRALVEQSLVAVAVIGANGRILYANPQAAALCGAHSSSEIEGRLALSLIAPGTEESMQTMIEAVLAGGPPLRARQWRVQQVSGAQITVEFNATGINYLGGAAVQVEFRDITVAAAAHAALERIASTDPLTGLLNRRAWDAALQALLDGGGCVPLVIAFIDLDRFKAYNDFHGHSAGDALLRDFAGAARAVLRDQDVLVRWGGEEFVVALPDTNAEQAARIFERVRSSVPAGQTCSIGFTTWNPPEALNAALVRADQALYQAKRRGRDQVARG
ncbi:sensor domain-containing diguanylate cyclase [Mycobacterium timonense]|uniref:sensor domain-containing diguanylate cyclase n=1 Tax=Mycobacterium timonense TaxID=701043 RepID=UPI001FCAB0C1|nr:diguanylate cyclase [Mycobacterium timonense]